MKLGFQGWFLGQPYTGIGQHSLGLLRALIQEKTKCTVVVPSPIRIEGVPAAAIHVLPPKAWLIHPKLKKWYWEAVQVPQFFSEQKLDWEYYPYPHPLPRYSAHLRAMTVHDTILWNDARYRGGLWKALYHKYSQKSVAKVDQVFAVSKSTQAELGIPAKVLYNGCPELPKGITKSFSPTTLVYVGGYDIRKQVPELIHAFGQLKGKLPELTLLLVGTPHHYSKYYPELSDSPGVKKLGTMSDEKLYKTLKNALAFVHYSDSEGFNLPLLQAMAVGTPAVVRDLPVNREISQNTSLYFDPSQNNPLFDMIVKLQKPKFREQVVQKQKNAAKYYSWKKAARDFLSILKS